METMIEYTREPLSQTRFHRISSRWFDHSFRYLEARLRRRVGNRGGECRHDQPLVMSRLGTWHILSHCLHDDLSQPQEGRNFPCPRSTCRHRTERKSCLKGVLASTSKKIANSWSSHTSDVAVHLWRRGNDSYRISSNSSKSIQHETQLIFLKMRNWERSKRAFTPLDSETISRTTKRQ